jgi:hypothetical protein
VILEISAEILSPKKPEEPNLYQAKTLERKRMYENDEGEIVFEFFQDEVL